VLIADACRSVVGRAVPGDDAGVGDSSLAAAKTRGVWYLSSCSPGQTSQEDASLGAACSRTTSPKVSKVLLTASARGRRMAWLPSPRLRDYAASKVETWSRGRGANTQLPCRSEHDVSGGEMVLAVVGAGPAGAVNGQPATVARPQGTHKLRVPSSLLMTSRTGRAPTGACPQPFRT